MYQQRLANQASSLRQEQFITLTTMQYDYNPSPNFKSGLIKLPLNLVVMEEELYPI